MNGRPRSSRRATRALAAAVTLSIACACAHTATDRLRMVPTRTGPVARLSDVRLTPGADCVVTLTSGDMVRGRLAALDADAIVLKVRRQAPPHERRVLDAEIASLGRVVGRAKPRRAWIGALVGAAISLPLGISMPGDMMVPAGLLGGFLGRGTGDSRIEIVLQR